MEPHGASEYYPACRARFLKSFNAEAAFWRSVLASQCGPEAAVGVLAEACQQFEELLTRLPDIGGDENPLTGALVESAGFLALYLVLKKRGWAVEEAAKIMYDALLARRSEAQAPIPPAKLLTPGQLMERRKNGAERSLERRYPGDYVYEFVRGDGVEFDYGYNFLECASLKLFQAWDADEFAPFYCYLDFPKSMLGLQRTQTLAEGAPFCNHRFKTGRQVKLGWPPPFLQNE